MWPNLFGDKAKTLLNWLTKACKASCLFTPSDQLESTGVLTPTCITTCNDDGSVILTKENHNSHPIILNEGVIIRRDGRTNGCPA